MTATRYKTAIDIMARTCKSIGLPVPTTFVGSADPIAVQMVELLTEAGRELMTSKWQMMNRTWTFATTPPVLEYTLPTDVDFIEPSTGWNLTAQTPLVGPMTDQQWATIGARNLGGTTLYMQWQVSVGKLAFYHVPDVPQNISIAYTSRGWVQSNADPLERLDFIDTDGDIPLFDPLLLQMLLRLKWRTNKGFDTTSQRVEYERFLNTIKSRDIPSPDLPLSRPTSYPYLGYGNMPDTGYGS